jgi:hypothetical protein
MPYPAQSPYYPGAPASYPQSMPPRVMAPAPNYSYQFPPEMPGPSAAEQPEGTHPPQHYGGYGGLVSASHRGDSYYSQSSIPEAAYGHQYMPFRQPHVLLYPESGPPPSPHPSNGSSSSQRPNSPDQRASDPRSRRIEDVKYGSVCTLFSN